MNKLIDDISLLSGIPATTCSKLKDLVVDIICHNIAEAIAEGKNSCSIDIILGSINLYWDNEIIRYKFIPYTSFEDKISEVLKTSSSPILKTLNLNIDTCISNIYKELM